MDDENARYMWWTWVTIVMKYLLCNKSLFLFLGEKYRCNSIGLGLLFRQFTPPVKIPLAPEPLRMLIVVTKNINIKVVLWYITAVFFCEFLPSTGSSSCPTCRAVLIRSSANQNTTTFFSFYSLGTWFWQFQRAMDVRKICLLVYRLPLKFTVLVYTFHS